MLRLKNLVLDSLVLCFDSVIPRFWKLSGYIAFAVMVCG